MACGMFLDFGMTRTTVNYCVHYNFTHVWGVDRRQIPKGDLATSGRMHICSFDNCEQIPIGIVYLLEVSETECLFSCTFVHGCHTFNRWKAMFT